MLLESQLRKLISHLLIEAKVDVLAARYPHIPVHTLDALAALDPSPTKKYLEWMVKVVDSGETNDLEELNSLIKQFDKAQQRLQNKDINSYTFEHLKTTLSTTVAFDSNRALKKKGQQVVSGAPNGWNVYFMTSHQAVIPWGNKVRWCITQTDGEHWDDYIQDVKFFFAERTIKQNDADDHIAYACHLASDRIQVFDALDTTIDSTYEPIAELSTFIQQIKNNSEYNNYTATGKGTYTKIVDNIAVEIMRIDPEDGSKEWYNAKRQLHREDGPAVIRSNGDKAWYINGQLHREGGPALEYANGTKMWFIHGKRHREDGPAVINAQKTEWYLNDMRHRIGGPAVEFNNRNTKEWWEYGKMIHSQYDV